MLKHNDILNKSVWIYTGYIFVVNCKMLLPTSFSSERYNLLKLYKIFLPINLSVHGITNLVKFVPKHGCCRTSV